MYDRIKNLKVAFVVDECHRAVTPERKRHLENSLQIHFGMVSLGLRFSVKQAGAKRRSGSDY